jgi:hypothetical protein
MIELTNRRSRGPCKTDAVMEGVFEKTGRCIGAISSIAEGAILDEILMTGKGRVRGMVCGMVRIRSRAWDQM